MHEIYDQIADIINFVGFAVIIVGSIRSLYLYGRFELTRLLGKPVTPAPDEIRCDFGSYLLLGLEFSVAADVIATFLEPSNEALIQLGVLIAIRTIIGFFVGRERAEFKQEVARDTA